MRHSMIALSIVCLMTVVACDEATSPQLLPFGGRVTGTVTGQLQIFPSAVQLTVGQSADLQTNAPLSLINQVQWLSSNPNIAAVSPSGRVTGRFPGVATITARFAFDTTRSATALATVLGVAGP
jgi:hypothetical protein